MQHHDSIIAIILADKPYRARAFLNAYKLPTTGFIQVFDRDHLRPLDPKIPVIYTYGEGEVFDAAVEFAKLRFKSVRYIDF